MSHPDAISCTCGKVRFDLSGAPIKVAECLCGSCRAAGEILEALPNAPPLLEATGGTQMALFRKDRVACGTGAEHLREFRLTPESHTRRLVATCCNSAMALDFTKGHWLSIFGRRWPDADRPKAEMRIMVGDPAAAQALPADIPNFRSFPARLLVSLLAAFAAMGFRSKPFPVAQQALETAQ